MISAEKIEDLFIRSLDMKLSTDEQAVLVNGLRENPSMAGLVAEHKNLRGALLRPAPETFGPYFAGKVLHRIQQLGVEIDYHIAFFFKKYQLIVLGVLVALLIVNLALSDDLTPGALIGLQDTTNTTIDEPVSFHFYDDLTQ